MMEYAKVDPLDILIRVSVTNHGPEAAPIHVLPTLWFRNTWAWGYDDRRPQLTAVKVKQAKAAKDQVRLVQAQHHELGESWLACEGTPELLFTENETNNERLWNVPNPTPYVKDGINEIIVNKAEGKVNPDGVGTKVAAHYALAIEPGQTNFIVRSAQRRPMMSAWSSVRRWLVCSGVSSSSTMMWIPGCGVILPGHLHRPSAAAIKAGGI